MADYRLARIKSQLQIEISDILRNMKDPRIGFATVTAVDVSGDMRHVKVFVSIMGDEEEQKESLKALQNAEGFVRTEVGQRVPLRHTPEVIFRLDGSMQHGANINRILKSLERGENS
jgi:ribosome-binding factor A